MAETGIEWTDATWNPVAGCSLQSAECTHCYAMQMARRLDAMGIEKYNGLKNVLKDSTTTLFSKISHGTRLTAK